MARPIRTKIALAHRLLLIARRELPHGTKFPIVPLAGAICPQFFACTMRTKVALHVMVTLDGIKCHLSLSDSKSIFNSGHEALAAVRDYEAYANLVLRLEKEARRFKIVEEVENAK